MSFYMLPMGGAGGSSFDQDLNTTDDVAFNSITLPTGVDALVIEGLDKIYGLVSASSGFTRQKDEWQIQWASGGSILNAADLGLARNAAGILEVNVGTAGDFGHMVMDQLILNNGSAQTPRLKHTNNNEITVRNQADDNYGNFIAGDVTFSRVHFIDHGARFIKGGASDIIRVEEPGVGTGFMQAKYKSGDGTSGVTAGPFTTITAITVKDGIVTSLTGS